MNVLAIVLILIGILVMDLARRGRITHLGDDLPDAFLAFFRQDADAFGEVISRHGDDATASETAWRDIGGSVADTLTDVASKSRTASTGLAAECIKLGSAAKGYKWTATGPDYYDCSGLIWRACTNLGIYSGPRFTTYTIGALSTFVRVTSPAVNDIVVWPTRHMGVVTGPDKFYSARSRRTGIGYGTISTWARSSPVYYRPKGVADAKG